MITFLKKYRPEKAVSTDDHRPALAHPWRHGDRILATDGRIAASIPVHAEKPDADDAPISIDAIKLARKHTGREDENLQPIQLGSRWQRVVHTIFKRPIGKEVLPLPFEQLTEMVAPPLTGDTPFFRVSLDPQLLLKLAQALGCEHSVTLSWHGTNAIDAELGMIKVTPNERNNSARGVLMPMRTVEQ